jgi:hypothetical protein
VNRQHRPSPHGDECWEMLCKGPRIQQYTNSKTVRTCRQGMGASQRVFQQRHVHHRGRAATSACTQPAMRSRCRLQPYHNAVVHSYSTAGHAAPAPGRPCNPAAARAHTHTSGRIQLRSPAHEKVDDVPAPELRCPVQRGPALRGGTPDQLAEGPPSDHGVVYLTS